ncbi:hypothetical protein N8E87_06975 [Avibacterium paragallinarum]|uniref:hypothetical protein n=1 Tax=Avibacterium paragallinarum TaxID=728 RepID=UPI0021F6D7CD|nr:hypothetical protein [Avibacterium paragallinarum]UXN35943.1 hypothetical protein N8E87_06975 [Avibacterium paragallinarum]
MHCTIKDINDPIEGFAANREPQEDPETYITSEDLKAIHLKKSVVCAILGIKPEEIDGNQEPSRKETFLAGESEKEKRLKDTIKSLQKEANEAKKREHEYKTQFIEQKTKLTANLVEKLEKYNPTERETHLLMINALANIITKPNFRAGAAKYLKANGINQSAIYGGITEEISRILNAPETNERSEETIKKRLKEAMALETKQAE